MKDPHDWATRDRQLVRAAVEVRELAERRDLRVEGYLVVHDGDCPRGGCTCEPLEILKSR